VAGAGSFLASFYSKNALSKLLIVQKVVLVFVILDVESPDLLFRVVETYLFQGLGKLSAVNGSTV
jgi:hypothetical protein